MLTKAIPPIVSLLTEVDFGQDGNSSDFCLTGFSHPEFGHTWGLSPRSSISFPPMRNAACIFILFEIEPFVPASGYGGLDLWILVDAEVKKVLKLADRLVVAIRIEAPEKIDAGFRMNFLCFDAAHPKNYLTGEMRPLAFRLGKVFVYGSPQRMPSVPRFVDRILGSRISEITDSIFQKVRLAPAELALQFENLGNFCDFGFFQRRLNVEPLSLFRFSGIQIADLVRGILVGFKGLGESFDLHYSEELQEYRVTENGFGITSHTHVRVGELGEDAIIERERRRLRFLRRKFMEDVALGGKTFLLRRPNPDDQRHIEALWVALNMHAENRLLLVKQTPEWSQGLRVHGFGILEGEVGGEIGQTQPDTESWLKLLGNACLCDQA